MNIKMYSSARGLAIAAALSLAGTMNAQSAAGPSNMALAEQPELTAAVPAAPDPVALIVPVRKPKDCAKNERAKGCGIRWGKTLTESAELLGILHWGNVPTYRGHLSGSYFRGWFDAVDQQRFTVWNDNDPFIVDYVAHPMTGATVGFILIQNDPVGRSLTFENSRAYWKSRLKAMGYAAAFSAQWEIGPMSEASFGRLGSFKYYSKASKGMTNGTGMTDFVMTPVGGLAWIVGEDLIDKHLISRLERRSRNPIYLSAISILNPNRSFANLLRMKAPWFRDSRNRESDFNGWHWK